MRTNSALLGERPRLDFRPSIHLMKWTIATVYMMYAGNFNQTLIMFKSRTIWKCNQKAVWQLTKLFLWRQFFYVSYTFAIFPTADWANIASIRERHLPSTYNYQTCTNFKSTFIACWIYSKDIRHVLYPNTDCTTKVVPYGLSSKNKVSYIQICTKLTKVLLGLWFLVP